MAKKILIVDDEAHIRMLIEQTLEELEDGETEPDHRDRRPYPRHERPLDRQPGAQPGEMIRCRCPYFEPAGV